MPRSTPADHPVPTPVGAPAEPVRHQPRRAHAAELALPFDDQRLQPVTRRGQRGSDARRAAAADHQVVGLGNRDLPRLIGDSRLHESTVTYPYGEPTSTARGAGVNGRRPREIGLPAFD